MPCTYNFLRKKYTEINAVQEAFGAKHYYEALEAIIITVSDRFTKSATKFADKLGVHLVTRLELERLIKGK